MRFLLYMKIRKFLEIGVLYFLLSSYMFLAKIMFFVSLEFLHGLSLPCLQIMCYSETVKD